MRKEEMKRLSIAMTALAVMGLMTMVSCRKPNMNNVIPGAPRTVTFNATTESNGGSKTYLEGLDVKWSENDVIYVNGTETGNQLKLASEPGSTFGSFSSQNFTAEAPYMVAYPEPTAISESEIMFTIPAEQNIYNNGSDYDLKGVLPMAAHTTDENADLQFKNMVNVLKLDLTGTQTITKIEVESTENLNGTFTVGASLTPTAISGSESTQKKITIDYAEDPLDLTTGPTVYVVLPRFGSAESTITVKFTGAAGVMTVGPKALTGSTTPNHMYDADVTVLLEWEASIVTIPVCAVHKNCASSGGVVTGTGVEEQGICWGTSENPTINDQKYVHQYAYSLSPLKLTPKDETANNTFTGFMSGLSANTEYHVRAYIRKGDEVKYGDDITFTTPSAEPFPMTQTVNFNLTEYPSLEWSKYNLGVDPNDLDEAADWYGDWYQWGDDAACSTISSGNVYFINCAWQSYRYAANSNSSLTKYCPEGSTSYWYSGAGSPDNKLQLDMTDDCVRQTLGNAWRLPTGGAINTTTGAGEWQALYNGTLWVWTDHYNGISDLKGYVVYKVKAAAHKKQRKTSDSNGNGGYAGYGSGYEYTLADTHMFLPAAGYRNSKELHCAAQYGYYWSRSLNSSEPCRPYIMYFRSDYIDAVASYDYRYEGFTVRPVQ